MKKFIDGSPVSEEYERAVASLVSGACDAQDHFSEDELERFAEEQKAKEQK